MNTKRQEQQRARDAFPANFPCVGDSVTFTTPSGNSCGVVKSIDSDCARMRVTHDIGFEFSVSHALVTDTWYVQPGGPNNRVLHVYVTPRAGYGGAAVHAPVAH